MSEELKIALMTECIHPKCSCTANCMFEDQQRYEGVVADIVVANAPDAQTRLQAAEAKLAKVREYVGDLYGAAGDRINVRQREMKRIADEVIAILEEHTS